ncbi:MAG: hypothetical protein NZM04_11190, partial [Methylacidiphilales bacterium]|nr:hypothetical protein [Candidatus Methylacidiphilales bacterium]
LAVCNADLMVTFVQSLIGPVYDPPSVELPPPTENDRPIIFTFIVIENDQLNPPDGHCGFWPQGAVHSLGELTLYFTTGFPIIVRTSLIPLSTL